MSRYGRDFTPLSDLADKINISEAKEDSTIVIFDLSGFPPDFPAHNYVVDTGRLHSLLGKGKIRSARFTDIDSPQSTIGALRPDHVDVVDTKDPPFYFQGRWVSASVPFGISPEAMENLTPAQIAKKLDQAVKRIARIGAKHLITSGKLYESIVPLGMGYAAATLSLPSNPVLQIVEGTIGFFSTTALMDTFYRNEHREKYQDDNGFRNNIFSTAPHLIRAATLYRRAIAGGPVVRVRDGAHLSKHSS